MDKCPSNINVLPSIRKNGSYVINPDTTDYSKYEIEELSKYYDYKVFYIFYVGFINSKHVFKYGITENIYKRYRQHKNDYEEYNNKIYPDYVAKCENNREIESAFGDEMIRENLKLDGKNFPKFKGKKTELTTISNVYPIEFLFEKADYLIKNIKSRDIIERENNEYKRKTKGLVETINNLENEKNDLKNDFKNEKNDLKNDKNNLENDKKDLKEKYEDLMEKNREVIENLKEKDNDNKDKIEELRKVIKNLKSKKNCNYVNN